jgi:outer membrane protein TolC
MQKIFLNMKQILIALLIGLSGFQVQAQNKLSLKDAIRIGLENNFQIKISNQNIEKTRLNNNWGTVGRYPSITLGTNLNNKYTNAKSTTTHGTRDKNLKTTLYPNLNLRWILFNGFAVKISKEKLALLQKFSEGYSGIIVENTIQAIILAYYKVQLETEKLTVLESVKRISRDRYNYVMQKKEFGSSVTYDVLQAKNAYLSDSSSYLLQQLNFKNTNLNLNLLLGEEASVRFELTEALKVITDEYILEDLMNKMLSNNKTLKNQYINQEILKKEINFQRSKLFPTVSLNSGFNYFNSRIKFSGTSAAYTNSYDFYANVSLSFNLFNGGKVKRAIQITQIDERIGKLRIEEMQLKLKNVLFNLYDLYNIRRQLYDVSEANLKSAKLNLKISKEKYKSGAINSFNYRDIQLLYLNTAIRQYQAMYNLLDTHTELTRLTGGIIDEQ